MTEDEHIYINYIINARVHIFKGAVLWRKKSTGLYLVEFPSAQELLLLYKDSRNNIRSQSEPRSVYKKRWKKYFG